MRIRRQPPPLPRRAAVPSLIALAAVLAASCTVTTTGDAAPQAAAPDTVAGMPVTDGPSGLRPDAPAPDVDVAGGTGGRIDTIAAAALEDLGRFWSSAFPDSFHRPFTPVSRLVSWDSAAPHDPAVQFCGGPVSGVANAGFCRSYNEIGWDRGPLMSGLVDEYGELAPVVVLAHEYGHVVQYQTGLRTAQAPTIVLEQQADCYAGVFLHHVAQGESEHFTMNTTDGLGAALSVLVAIRDSPDPAEFGGAEHGSAFERITAFQEGFTGDPAACARIDAADVDARRGPMPLEAIGPGGGAPRPIDDAMLAAVARTFTGMLRAGAEDPRSASTGAGAADSTVPGFGAPDTADPSGGCDHPTSPAAFCPGTGRVAADLPGLARTADGGAHGLAGDFTAYSIVASRYALAAAQARGASLTGERAALRTACMTGAWAAHLAGKPSSGTGLQLRPGDLDEAVAGLLDGGLIAADVRGTTVPSAFARLDAYRAGFLDGTGACRGRYP